MSSIAGIISQNGKINDDSTSHMRTMLENMRHRGPHNTVIRTLFNHRGTLGANELNVVPEMTYATALSEAPYILFDGELYNERSGDQTDVDLFKAYYQTHGRDCFKLLDGTFSCAILEKDGEVVLVRDHVGARPLFYGANNGSFFFSTEMKGLVDHLRFNIQELPPGHYFTTKKGLQAFEAFEPEIPEVADLDSSVRTLRQLLIHAVKRRMKGVGGISLSGGLDSSIVAAIAKDFNPKLSLFTGTLETAPGPDLENAILMAEFLGLEHHVYKISDSDIEDFITDAIWYLESFDEDCISGIISNYYVSRLAAQHTQCVLVGEGADELFGGYRMVLKNPKVKDDEERERLAQRLLEISYNTALRRLDRAWMANGVTYRTPFLDQSVVAFSQKIPMKWKIYGEKQIEKYILREAFRDMLPEKIADREKLRFSMGVGMDDVMDGIISRKIDPKEIEARPKAAYGLPFASFKELYYYDEFLRMFPPSYENQTVRWDPFK